MALAIVDRAALSLCFASAGAAWALALNLLYARDLRRHVQEAGVGARTQRRADGDHFVALQQLVAFGVPIVASGLLLATGIATSPDGTTIEHQDVQGLLGVLSATVVIWLASSHVDWYYIRPRIDGVVGSPPCETSGDERWKGVTRKWYLHRGGASLAKMTAAVLIAAIATVVLNREWSNVLGAIGGFAAAASVALWLMGDEVRNANAVRGQWQSPKWILGDDLSYDTDMWKRRGFVLHISVAKTKLVALDRETGAIEPLSPLEEATTLLQQVHLTRRLFECGGRCQQLNRETLSDQDREERPIPPRWIAT